MRQLIKTANKIDTIWTAFVMFPAVILLMNAAINLHQGTATPADLTKAANITVTKFSSQYTPYIESTGVVIVSGVKKLFKTVGLCNGRSGLIYTNPALAGKKSCAFDKVSGRSTIKPYRHY